MKKRVLILCTGNSCRSQMAEGLWRHLGSERWEPFSAGSKPAGYMHPLAVKAIGEIEIDIARNPSKHVDEFSDAAFDLVVTVCDSARESCPILPCAKRVMHWPFKDPAGAGGSEEERMQVFRKVRDQIREEIEEYLHAEECA